MIFTLSIIGHMLSAILIGHAHAQVSSIVQNVSGGMTTIFSGAGWAGGACAGCRITGIAGAIVQIVWLVILPIAIFLVVRAGFSLIISQEEDKLSKAKRTIASTGVGIVLAFISQSILVALYKVGVSTTLPGTGPAILQDEVNGIINWVTTLGAVLGVVIIIVSGIRVIGSFGKEDGFTKMRNTVAGVAGGILLIIMQPIIKATLGISDLVVAGTGNAPNAVIIVSEAGGIISNLLLFLTLIAVCVVIYAAVRMMLNLGDEEEFKKSRALIIRALIGLIVILLSYAFAQFIVQLAS